MQRLDYYRRQAARYTGFSVWFLRDIFARLRAHILWICAASILGLSCDGVAIYLSYAYAHALERGIPVTLLGWEVQPRTSTFVLSMTALGVYVLIVTSATLIMRARVRATHIAREYADFCRQRAFVFLSQWPISANKACAEEVNWNRMMQLVHRDSQYCGLTLRILVYALLPVGTVIVTSVYLFIVDPMLSSIVVAILAISSVFFYRISIEGAAARTYLERRSKGIPLERTRIADRITYRAAPIDYGDAELQQMHQHGATRASGDAMERQRRVLEQINLVSQLAIGTAVFLIFLIQGGATLRNESNWSLLLVYLTALSLFATSFARTIRMITSINRFYPVISRYGRFVESTKAGAIGSGSTPNWQGLRIEALCLDSNTREVLELTANVRVAVIMPRNLNRFDLVALANAVGAHGGATTAMQNNALWFACVWTNPLLGTIRELFGFPYNYRFADLCKDLASLESWKTMSDEIPRDLDAVLNKNSKVLSSRTAFILASIAGFRRGCPVVVLDEGGLTMLTSHDREHLLALFDRRLLCIAHTPNSVTRLGEYGESKVIFCGGAKITYWSTLEGFYAARKRVDLILDGLRAEASKRRSRTTAGEDEDDLGML